MGWQDAYGESKGGLQGIMGQMMQAHQVNEQQESRRGGGLLGLLGGALTMLIPGGQVAGIGMMAGGLGQMF